MKTQAEQYQAYRDASQAILDAKEAKKACYEEAKHAGQKARSETVGTFEEKLAAVKAAVEPYQEKIAALDAEIEKHYAIADYNFEAYRGVVK